MLKTQTKLGKYSRCIGVQQKLIKNKLVLVLIPTFSDSLRTAKTEEIQPVPVFCFRKSPYRPGRILRVRFESI